MGKNWKITKAIGLFTLRYIWKTWLSALSLAFSVFIISHQVLKNTDWSFWFKNISAWVNEWADTSCHELVLVFQPSLPSSLLLLLQFVGSCFAAVPRLTQLLKYWNRSSSLSEFHREGCHFIVVKVIAFSIPPRPHFIIIQVLPITFLQPFHRPIIFCFTGFINFLPQR